MKTKLFIITALLMLNGCILIKDAAYQRDIEFYKAQSDIAKAQIKAQERPLATFKAQSGEVFTVNYPGKVTAPAMQQHENRAWRFGETLVNSTPLQILAGGWAVKEIVNTATGDIVSSGSGDITSTSNSNNTTDIANADNDLTQNTDAYKDSSDNSAVDSSDNSDNSWVDDNSDNRTNYENQTADPTVIVGE